MGGGGGVGYIIISDGGESGHNPLQGRITAESTAYTPLKGVCHEIFKLHEYHHSRVHGYVL